MMTLQFYLYNQINIQSGLLLIYILFMSSCNLNFRDTESLNLKPLARVENKFLYYDDLILYENNPDSVRMVQQQINEWIKKEVILLHAYNNVNERSLINQKIKKYEDDLILYEYENDLISNKIDFSILDAEIENYYSENIKDFILPSEIVRCLYSKIPLEAPELNKFKTLISKYPQSNLDEIKSYSFQFAEKHFLDDSIWIEFNELIANTPLLDIEDNISFLKYNKFLEISDENYYYFIKIIDYKLSGDVSPLSFESEIIKAILLNKKKKYLLNKLQDSIYLKFIDQIEYEVF